MKRAIPFVIFLFLAVIAKTQIFYNQGFNISLVASGWTNTDLAVPWGNGVAFGISNQWQVSDAESGRPANICGGASLGNPSLYMGATGLGSGAAYLSNASTNRRIASPNISTVGKTNITLSFNFIGNGYLTADKAYLQYSINGGTSWVTPAGAPTSSNPALPVGSNLNNLKSQICGSGQGRWTNVTWSLPATTENIANFRVAFVWQNDPATGGSASDPSFAVDDVQLSTISLPITLLSFTGNQLNNNTNLLKWITSSEINNDFFTLEHSTNANKFIAFGTVKGAGNSNTTLFYDFIDEHPLNGINYYRLKQTDFDGKYSYSDVVAIKSNDNEYNINYANQNLFVSSSLNEEKATIEIYDLLGKLVYSNSLLSNQIISTSNYNAGIYIIKIGTPDNLVIKKIKF